MLKTLEDQSCVSVGDNRRDAAEPGILLVDDDVGFLEDLASLIHGRFPDLPIDRATSVAQALENLNRTSYALVVVDQVMPGMSGLDALAAIHREWPQARVMMLTGHPEFDLAMDAVNRGQVVDFLAKPPEQSRLFEAVARALIETAIPIS